ncbi:MAG: global cell cycle regulator GcrA-like protein [Alphaproteobacteria bacterium]|nr:global cell cycle regulator GcrA-like protein [Alphaproteobacteria bacterium]
MWTEEKTALLRQLWESGLSASEIAKRLGGISRNAVIGKAHRIGLAARPSPIRIRPELPAAAPVFGGRTCAWPIGDPGQADFRFCGDRAVAGRPYCAVHCAQAYRKRDRDAA